MTIRSADKAEDQFVAGGQLGVPTDPEALRLWNAYLDFASRVARRLPETERRDLVLELRSHLAESFASPSESGESDQVARVNGAIARLGDPRDFLHPILADHLLERGSRSFRPRLLAEGLYHSAFGGLKTAITSVSFALAYVLIVTFAAMALLKAFFPNHVGYFVYPDGSRSLGIVADTTSATDALGLWVVPLALASAAILYALLNIGLRATRRRRA